MGFPIAALAGGSLIFVVVIVAILFAVVFGFYTYREARSPPIPATGRMARPAQQVPNEASGKGRTSEDNPDEFSAGGGFSSHGTK
ncbi:MAG: hypothetical protein M3022_13285 [Actinomycetota bacterium]|nr:hypothetical protein [Actinomycetota bacterium]